MNGTEIEVTSHNLANVDLFAISPSITSVTLNPGTYTEIEVKVMLTRSANPDSIPLKLKGTFASGGGTSIPIEFDFNDNATVKAEAENVVVTTGMDYTSLVQMHLDKLLAGITAADLDNAAQTTGAIIISLTSNTDLYNKIKDNLGSSCDHQFREHHHGDGNEDGNNNGGHDGGNHN
jgi:antitoxin component of RelBE/YafQ-DinJ toxin-antitoxin module